MSKPASENRIDAFEKSLAELETLVEQLEKGDLSLEDSLKQFERGIALARGCQQSLKEAELKVQQLIEKNGAQALAGFDTPEAGE